MQREKLYDSSTEQFRSLCQFIKYTDFNKKKICDEHIIKINKQFAHRQLAKKKKNL